MLGERLSLTSIIEEPEIVLVSPHNEEDFDSEARIVGCVPNYCLPFCRITTCQPRCGIIPTCRPICRIPGPN